MLRNPYSVKHWQLYIDHLKSTKSYNLKIVYERALKQHPGSYELWYNYLQKYVSQLKGRCITDPLYGEVNNAFERALVFMHKMPRIWMDYCTLMTEQCYITRTCQVFERALTALPITQHQCIWPLYIEFMKKSNLHETTVTVFRRYLEFAPEDTEDYIEYLISIDRLDEAAVKLAEIATQVDFVSKHGKSNQQLWNELGNLISKNPSKIKSLNVDAIIGEGLRRFIYQSGPLWNSLADYYVCSGLFERARDIYEEAMQTVTTVRDFAQVFDAYAQFEELGLSKCMERAAKNRIEDDDIELQLRLARFEHLMESHLLLLNAVSLRQNPPNVQEWCTRIRVYEDQPHERYKAMFEKIITLNIATPETVLNYSIFLIKNNQCDEAFRAYEKGIAHFKWPNVYDIWKTYLKLFLKQYRGTKLKETRDLFERCLEHCPPQYAKSFYLLYAKFEEMCINVQCLYTNEQETLFRRKTDPRCSIYT